MKPGDDGAAVADFDVFRPLSKEVGDRAVVDTILVILAVLSVLCFFALAYAVRRQRKNMISAKIVNMAPLYDKAQEFSEYSISRSPSPAVGPPLPVASVAAATQNRLADDQISKFSENEKFDSIQDQLTLRADLDGKPVSLPTLAPNIAEFKIGGAKSKKLKLKKCQKSQKQPQIG